MKKLRLLLPVILLAFLLNGCGFFLPFGLPQAYLERMVEAEAETEPVELPAAETLPAHLSAEDIYWRCKLAVKETAYQYRTHMFIDLTIDYGVMDAYGSLEYETTVSLDPDTCAVNILHRYSWGDEFYEIWNYFRDEDGKLVKYEYDLTTGEAYREVVELDGLTPFAIIADMAFYPCPVNPRNLAVEPQTRILDGTEVYVLTYEQSSLDVLGYTGNTARDTQLQKRFVPATMYLDVQTNMPVKITSSLFQVDDLIGGVLDDIYGITGGDTTITIDGFTYTQDNIVYEPVEVSPIPQEVLDKAWENAGFSGS